MFNKQEFIAVRREKFVLKTLKEKLKDLRENIGPARANLSGMPGVPKDSMKSDLFAKMTSLMDISLKYSQMLIDNHLHIARLEKQMSSLPVNTYQILYYRYFMGLSWKEISKLTSYHEAHCRKLAGFCFKKDAR